MTETKKTFSSKLVWFFQKFSLNVLLMSVVDVFETNSSIQTIFRSKTTKLTIFFSNSDRSELEIPINFQFRPVRIGRLGFYISTIFFVEMQNPNLPVLTGWNWNFQLRQVRIRRLGFYIFDEIIFPILTILLLIIMSYIQNNLYHNL